MGETVGKSGRMEGLERDLVGLRWLWDFGWLRPQELGALVWKDAAHATKYAERLGRKWEAKGLVIPRTLPEHCGTAWVLSQKGAEFLTEYGTDAKTGKDWGETKGGEWVAPKWWKHDLLANSLLARFSCLPGHSVIPERRLRRENDARKLPDGLITNPKGVTYWVEVESARKTGASMDLMAQSLIRVAEGKAPTLSGLKAAAPIVAYREDAQDERGHGLNHELRVISAVSRFAAQDVKVNMLPLVMKGAAVAGWGAKQVQIPADAISRRLAQWEKTYGWDDDQNEPGVKRCYVAGLDARFWQAQEGTWGWEILDHRDDRPSHLRYQSEFRPTRVAGGTATNAKAARRALAGHRIWQMENF